jgi:hypothetical protein
MNSKHAAPDQSVDTLLAALDEIDLGVVLLDNSLQVKFVNLAFLRPITCPKNRSLPVAILKGLCGLWWEGGAPCFLRS